MTFTFTQKLTAATARETIYNEIRRTDMGPTLIGDMLHYISTLTPQNGQTIPNPYHLAGFSLRDREILESFTAQYLESGHLTFKQLGVAGNRLPKYWRQLAHWYGFEVDYTHEPDKDPTTFTITPKVVRQTPPVKQTKQTPPSAGSNTPITSRFDPRNTNSKFPRYNDLVTDGVQTITVKDMVQTYASDAQRQTTLYRDKGAWGRLFSSVNTAVGNVWRLTDAGNATPEAIPAHIMNDSPAPQPVAAFKPPITEVSTTETAPVVYLPVGTQVIYF